MGIVFLLAVILLLSFLIWYDVKRMQAARKRMEEFEFQLFNLVSDVYGNDNGLQFLRYLNSLKRSPVRVLLDKIKAKFKGVDRNG